MALPANLSDTELSCAGEDVQNDHLNGINGDKDTCAHLQNFDVGGNIRFFGYIFLGQGIRVQYPRQIYG